MFGVDDVAVATGVGPGMSRSIALGFARHGVDLVLAALTRTLAVEIGQWAQAVTGQHISVNGGQWTT